MSKFNLSPTARTLRFLKQKGIICDVVERFNPYIGKFGARIDTFHFIDVLALDPIKGIVAVQCCGQTGHAEHKRKILENEIAPEWIKSGGKIELWSWSKRKLKRGGKAIRWTPKVEEIKF